MSLRPKSFAEAKANHKPLKRSGFKRKAKKKKVKAKTLKRKAWDQFSIFIRIRGADTQGINRCFTCDVRLPWKQLHAGHFIRGRLNANLFDERGCQPQCYGCNIGRQGHVAIYYQRMEALYGRAVIDELIAQNQQTRKWEGGELEAIYQRYVALNKANPLVE